MRRPAARRYLAAAHRRACGYLRRPRRNRRTCGCSGGGGIPTTGIPGAGSSTRPALWRLCRADRGMTTRSLVGHVVDKLAELSDESVSCVVMSPPYYGLRDYGLEPQVWSGDPNCSHAWQDATVVDNRHL